MDSTETETYGIEPDIYNNKFEIMSKRGTNPYSFLWKAIDKKTNQMCTLIKVANVFQNDTTA